MAASHTIILVQYTSQANTRTYFDYDNVNEAVDSVVKMYEQKLKLLNPTIKNITYEVSQLFQYIDSLGDLSALVFDAQAGMYSPYGKEWIKSRIFQSLKKQAAH